MAKEFYTSFPHDVFTTTVSFALHLYASGGSSNAMFDNFRICFFMFPTINTNTAINATAIIYSKISWI